MNCECVICKNQKSFTMPDAILDASKSGNIVLFCGAGISTENKNVLPYSFYTSIQEELELTDHTLSFSEVMQQYCDRPNGRRNLLQKIKERFEYIHSFPELENRATTFHRELAELYFIKTIVTTNWDTFFEEYCSATPIIIPEDFVFWDDIDRCVLKIHGSINNLGSIIATKSDYKQCKRKLEKGIIGATLKTILASKTVIFIGFSFGDEDFAQILDYLRKEMKDVLPHIYIVTLDENLCNKLNYKNCTYIVTDGTYFLHQLKLLLKEKNLIVNCDSMELVMGIDELLEELHGKIAKIDFRLYPSVIYCLAYQDGVMHAFDRYIRLYAKGDYNIPGQVAATARAYDELVQRYAEAGDFWNEAYYEGYLNGLIFITFCDKNPSIVKDFPFLYLPNTQNTLSSYDIFLEELKSVTKLADKYHQYAVTLTSNLKTTKIVLHHPPY